MIWCDISETVSGMDADMDGKSYQDNEQSNGAVGAEKSQKAPEGGNE